jgi:hypothetical protein
VVAIVAHRYGWAPPDQSGPKVKRTKSITWLECEQALKLKREVLAFLVDEDHPWPPRHIEYGQPQLGELKKRLGSIGFRRTFTTEETLKTGVLGALNDWLHRHTTAAEGAKPAPKRADPAKYLSWVREQTAWIDIRGLQVGTGQAHRFPIEELYIPLTTSASEDSRKGRVHPEDLRKPVPLEEALNHRRLVIVGDPGSGKTTFLRRIGLELCRGDQEASSGLALPFRAFPLLIRIADLEEHIVKCDRRQDVPTAKDSPAWLAHFLKSRSEENHWELDGNFFEEKLRGKATVVLLDGLDEAPSRERRQEMARLFENATAAYR